MNQTEWGELQRPSPFFSCFAVHALWLVSTERAVEEQVSGWSKRPSLSWCPPIGAAKDGGKKREPRGATAHLTSGW